MSSGGGHGDRAPRPRPAPPAPSRPQGARPGPWRRTRRPRFRREITLAAQLQHPHIVPVFDSGETADSDLWYTMPYVPGESHRARLRRERRLALPVVQTLARQMASALDYAHRRGTVHRDIKPENVLLSEDGDALVADFGIARDVAHPSDGRLTATGLSLGTPGYMSPEQIAGEREVDGRTDQYALGCLVYEALTGRPPFEGATAQAVIAKHAAAPVPLLRAERPSLPVSVEEAVARAMAKAPNERFPSAGAFAEALGYEGASTPAARDVPPAAGVSGSVPRVGGGRTAWIVGAVAVLVLSGAGAWWMRGRPQPAPAVPEFDPERVAVAAFQNRSGDKALDQVVQEFEEAIVQGIAQTPDVDMVPASVVRAAERRLEGGVVGGVASGDAPNAESLGRELGAGVIVGGSVSRGTGDSLVVRATITDGRTGRLLSAVEPIGAPRHALGPVVATVRERIRGAQRWSATSAATP
ncbi:MAG: protein kinase [Gemmatimonadetes bacterium]|nr:protein kinase [Gemmatimonadota bacterium]